MMSSEQKFTTGNGSLVKYALPKVNDNTKLFKDSAENELLKSRFEADKDTYINILHKKSDMTKFKEKWKEEEQDFKPKINKNSKYNKSRPGHISEMLSH